MHGGGSDVPNKDPEHSFTLFVQRRLRRCAELSLVRPRRRLLVHRVDAPCRLQQFVDARRLESQRQYGSYLQDMFSNDALTAMGGPPRHGNFVNLYINGIDWGLYNATEYPDSNFAARLPGGQSGRLRHDQGLRERAAAGRRRRPARLEHALQHRRHRQPRQPRRRTLERPWPTPWPPRPPSSLSSNILTFPSSSTT